jgi:predicted restriction endonuclease
MNAVVQRLSQLESRAYVVKAASQTRWFGWEYNRVKELRQQTGDEFYLILYGAEDDENDFFVIPYSAVSHALTESSLVKGEAYTERRRWMGRIRAKTNNLKLSGSETLIDLTPYKDNMRLLEYAVDGFRPALELSPDEADTTGEDEAPYVPTDEDSRVAVLRQIKARRGQQKFRNALRARYGDRCMITGCQLMDVVEAAHIKPHRGQQDDHPANGLLLRADLHTLYDLDFIGIEPETLTVRVHPDAVTAGYGQWDGKKLLCGDQQPSVEALALRWEHFSRKRETVEAATI